VRARAGKTRVRPIIGTMIELPRAALTADEIAGRPSSSASAPTT
jgi:phosphoenolpyruvate synthase/pyruvate phosphate dikinase